MRKLTLLLIFLCIPTALFAQDPDWRDRPAPPDQPPPHHSNPWQSEWQAWELTPFVGYRWGGQISSSDTDLFRHDVDVAGDINYGLNFGIPLGPVKLELMVNRQATHFTEGDGLFEPNTNLGDFTVTYYHAGVQFPFPVSQHVIPYGVISAGVANLNPHVANASADNRFSMSFGGGVKLPLNKNVGVRFDARGYFTFIGEDSNGGGCHCDYYYGYDNNFYQGETSIGLYFRF
jgi:hypothetical protein